MLNQGRTVYRGQLEGFGRGGKEGLALEVANLGAAVRDAPSVLVGAAGQAGPCILNFELQVSQH
jgi:hypothetical protein